MPVQYIQGSIFASVPKVFATKLNPFYDSFPILPFPQTLPAT